MAANVFDLSVVLSMVNKLGPGAAEARKQLNTVEHAAEELERAQAKLGKAQAADIARSKRIRELSDEARAYQNTAKKASLYAGSLEEINKKAKEKMMGGVGQVGAGAAMVAPVAVSVNAFASREKAETQLKAALTDATGQVSSAFDAIRAKAEELGKKFPGSTEDYIRMALGQVRSGVSPQAVATGGLEASAALAVATETPFDEAAVGVAKLKNSLGIADKDLLGFIDDIQRMKNAGVKDMTEAVYAFSRAGGAMRAFGMSGRDAAQEITPLITMLLRSGKTGEEAGTAISAMIQQSMNSDKINKVNQALQGTGVQLRFMDKSGKFLGVKNMIDQFDKLKGLSGAGRAGIIQELLGTGGDASTALSLIESGRAGYDAMAKELKKQADLKTRLALIAETLANKLEALAGTFLDLVSNVGGAIAGVLKPFLDLLNKIVGYVSDFAKANPVFGAVLGVVLSLVGGLLALGGTIKIIGGAFLYCVGPIKTVITALATFTGMSQYSSVMATAGVKRMSWAWMNVKMHILAAAKATWVLKAAMAIGIVGAVLVLIALIASAAMQWSAFCQGISLMFQGAGQIICGVVDVIRETFIIMFLYVRRFFMWVINGIVEGYNSIAKYVGLDVALPFNVDEATAEIEQHRENIYQSGQNIAAGAGMISSGFSKCSEAVSTGWGQVKEKIGIGGQEAAGAATEATQAVVEALPAGAMVNNNAAVETGKNLGGGVAEGMKRGAESGFKTPIRVNWPAVMKLGQFERYAQGAIDRTAESMQAMGNIDIAAPIARARSAAGGGGGGYGGGGGGGGGAAGRRSATQRQMDKHRKDADIYAQAMQAIKAAGVDLAFDGDVYFRVSTRIERGMSPGNAAAAEMEYQRRAGAAIAASGWMPASMRDKAKGYWGAVESRNAKTQVADSVRADFAAHAARSNNPTIPAAVRADIRMAPQAKDKQKNGGTVVIQNMNINAANGKEAEATRREVVKQLRHATEMA